MLGCQAHITVLAYLQHDKPTRRRLFFHLFIFCLTKKGKTLASFLSQLQNPPSMAFVHCLSFSTPLFLPRRRSSLSSSNLAIFPKLTLRNFGNSLPLLACSSRQSTPATEQDILEAVETSDGRSLPCVRTYENDLARLTVVGTVDFEQALTAAAADGGEAASEHISAGMPAMVVETVYPGLPDEHSTVSTRLVRSLYTSYLLLKVFMDYTAYSFILEGVAHAMHVHVF